MPSSNSVLKQNSMQKNCETEECLPFLKILFMHCMVIFSDEQIFFKKIVTIQKLGNFMNLILQMLISTRV